MFKVISSQVKACRSGFTLSEPWTDNTLQMGFAEFPASPAQPAYFFLFLVLYHLTYFLFSVLLSGGICLVWEEMNPQPTCPPSQHSAQVRVGSIKSTWGIPPMQLKCWKNLRSRTCQIQPLHFGHWGKSWSLFADITFPFSILSGWLICLSPLLGIQNAVCLCVLLYPVFSKASLLSGHKQSGAGFAQLDCGSA